MKKGFKKYLESFITLKPDEWKVLEGKLNIKKLGKGEILQEKNKPSRDMNFVIKGAIKSFLEKDGGDITWNFYFENRIATDFRSFIHDEPSPFTFVALEDSVVITISKQEIEDLYRSSPEFLRIEKTFAEHAFLDMRARVESFLLLTPEARYSSLLENDPELVRQLPNKDIATYLGIVPQSLSRIKGRLYKKRSLKE